MVVNLLHVDKALFRTSIGVRSEYNLEGKGSRPSQRIQIKNQGIVYPIELNRLPVGRIDQTRGTKDSKLIPVDLFQTIKMPQRRTQSVSLAAANKHQRDCTNQDKQALHKTELLPPAIEPAHLVPNV
jgi:hypothetical protein